MNHFTEIQAFECNFCKALLSFDECEVHLLAYCDQLPEQEGEE